MVVCVWKLMILPMKMVFLWYRWYTQFMKLKVAGRKCDGKTTIKKWPKSFTKYHYQCFSRQLAETMPDNDLGPLLKGQVLGPIPPVTWGFLEMEHEDLCFEQCWSHAHWSLRIIKSIHFTKKNVTVNLRELSLRNGQSNNAVRKEKKKKNNKAILGENTEESWEYLGFPGLHLLLPRIIEPNAFQRSKRAFLMFEVGKSPNIFARIRFFPQILPPTAMHF